MKVAVSIECIKISKDNFVLDDEVFPIVLKAENSSDLQEKIKELERRIKVPKGRLTTRRNPELPAIYAPLDSTHGKLVLSTRFRMEDGRILTDMAGRCGYDLTGVYSKN